ncbi:MAG: biotin/lipoyl-binding protein [Planctomycetota bacterium]
MSTSEYSQTPGSPDPDAVQRAKREIQGILQQIAELSRQDVEVDRFYEEFLNKVVAALAARGGAVWTLADSGQLQLTYQTNLRATGLIENPIGQEQHGRLLTRTLNEPGGVIVPPHSGAAGGSDTDDEHAAANPTDFLLVLAPVSNDQGVQGVVEVFQRPGGKQATQNGYLKFLNQTCDLVGDYLRSRRLVHLADKQSLWEQLESFTRTAHEKLDIRETAYTIANEGRRLIGCDRVTVAVQRGSKCVIEAISGLDTFDKRSNTARLLTNAARAVTKTAEDVWYSGDTSDFAPQVEKTIEAYVDESHTKQMAILPMVVHEDPDATPENQPRRKGPPKVLGCLVVEQMVDSTIPEGYRQRVDVVRSHSTTAIGNSIEHQSLFLMPLWKFLGRMTWMFRGRTLPKTLAVLTLVGGLIAAAALVQQPFVVMSKGELRPQKLTNVFAQISGDVKVVHVKQDQEVREGDVLIEQESLDLEKEIADIVGRLNEAKSEEKTLNGRIANLSGRTAEERQQRDEAAAELMQVETQLDGLQRQLQILKLKQDKLIVRSPTDGRVITYKVDEQLRSRPVQLGQVVMEIADLDPTNPDKGWQVRLDMPEKRMGHVTRAWQKLKEEDPDGTLKVKFFPDTHPETAFEGRVIEIDNTADTVSDDGNAVRMTVEFDQDKFLTVVTDPKVGARVQAKVYCGSACVAYAWLHDVAEAFQSQVLFRLMP